MCGRRIFGDDSDRSIRGHRGPQRGLPRGLEVPLRELATVLLLDPRVNLVDLVVHLATLSNLVLDLLDRVHHRRVVLAAEVLTDLGQAQVRQLANQVHGDLPGGDEDAAPGGARELSIVIPKYSAVFPIIADAVI